MTEGVICVGETSPVGTVLDALAAYMCAAVVGVMGAAPPILLDLDDLTVVGLKPLMACEPPYVKPVRVGETRPAKLREVGDSMGKLDAAEEARSEFEPKADVVALLSLERCAESELETRVMGVSMECALTPTCLATDAMSCWKRTR